MIWGSPHFRKPPCIESHQTGNMIIVNPKPVQFLVGSWNGKYGIHTLESSKTFCGRITSILSKRMLENIAFFRKQQLGNVVTQEYHQKRVV